MRSPAHFVQAGLIYLSLTIGRFFVYFLHVTGAFGSKCISQSYKDRLSCVYVDTIRDTATHCDYHLPKQAICILSALLRLFMLACTLVYIHVCLCCFLVAAHLMIQTSALSCPIASSFPCFTQPLQLPTSYPACIRCFVSWIWLQTSSPFPCLSQEAFRILLSFRT